jgi:hypothetical protein
MQLYCKRVKSQLDLEVPEKAKLLFVCSNERKEIPKELCPSLIMLSNGIIPQISNAEADVPQKAIVTIALMCLQILNFKRFQLVLKYLASLAYLLANNDF